VFPITGIGTFPTSAPGYVRANVPALLHHIIWPFLVRSLQTLFDTISVPRATLFLTLIISARLCITMRAGPLSHCECVTMTARTGPTEDKLKAMSGNEVAFVFLNPMNELYMNKVSRSRVF
jgi:hypothetical protein